MASRPTPTLVDLAGVGLTAGACVGIGVGVGYWIAETHRSGAVGTFVGLGIGVVAAVAATYFKVRRYL